MTRDDIIRWAREAKLTPTLGLNPDDRSVAAFLARFANLVAEHERAALAEPEATICPKCQGKGSIYMGCDSWIHCEVCNTTGKVYAPPRREWQGLTYEELKSALKAKGIDTWFSYRLAARAIEAALKEKNNV